MQSRLLLSVFIFLSSFFSYASPTPVELSVWANEAIVATYTYDFKNFIDQQRTIAKYFSASGWTAYSSAFNASGIPAAVTKNQYQVNAVALLPPEIKTLNPTHWQAVMPVLITYKNPQYQQTQTQKVTIFFSTTPTATTGVRGLVINSLQAVPTEKPCVCKEN